MLQQRGVKDIRALLGGWNQWVNDGNKVVKGEK
jgi:3-mercaptopyruvate sulfurtransferase SseA